MDDLEHELWRHEVEDDDISSDSSTEVHIKNKLPLVPQVCVGKLCIMLLYKLCYTNKLSG